MSKSKNIKTLSKRIVVGIKDGRYNEETIEKMLNALVYNYKNRFAELEKRASTKFILNHKNISGALKCCIDAHGDITKEYISSATKRIYGMCLKIMKEDI